MSGTIDISVLVWPPSRSEGVPHRATPLGLLEENGTDTSNQLMGQGIDAASALADLRYITAKHLDIDPLAINGVPETRAEERAVKKEAKRLVRSMAAGKGMGLG